MGTVRKLVDPVNRKRPGVRSASTNCFTAAYELVAAKLDLIHGERVALIGQIAERIGSCQLQLGRVVQ